MTNDASCPRIIWMLWLQGWDRAPPIAQACLQSWQRLNPSWRVQTLSRETLRDFLPLDTVDQILTTPADAVEALSDRIRIELLARYGGVWADASTLCARPLDEWLFDYLTSDFFAFEKPVPERMIASWFLAAKKGSYIVEEWRRRTENYWHERRERGDYFWFHQLFAQGYAADPQWRRLWDSTRKLPAWHLFHFGPHDAQLMGQVEQKYVDGLADPPAWVFKLSHKQDKPIEPGSTMEMLARYAAGDWPNAPQPVGAPAKAKRLLICWYGSFAGHGTIGDLRSLESAVTHLVGRGHAVHHATAAELNIPGARRVQWSEVSGAEYDALIFVCGPILGTHPQTNALFSHFAGTPLIGLGVSILPAESPHHSNPFQILFARQGAAETYGDIAIAAPPVARAPRVRNMKKIGISLRGAQSEYGEDKCRWQETERLARHAAAAALEVSGGYVVDIENHLQRSELTPDGVDALYADCDLIITSRFHGAVMALRYGVPFIAIDQIAGGAKVFDLLAPLGWPYCCRIDEACAADLERLAVQLVLKPDLDALNDARSRAIGDCAITLAALDKALTQ